MHFCVKIIYSVLDTAHSCEMNSLLQWKPRLHPGSLGFVVLNVPGTRKAQTAITGFLFLHSFRYTLHRLVNGSVCLQNTNVLHFLKQNL